MSSTEPLAPVAWFDDPTWIAAPIDWEKADSPVVSVRVAFKQNDEWHRRIAVVLTEQLPAVCRLLGSPTLAVAPQDASVFAVATQRTSCVSTNYPLERRSSLFLADGWGLDTPRLGALTAVAIDDTVIEPPPEAVFEHGCRFLARSYTTPYRVDRLARPLAAFRPNRHAGDWLVESRSSDLVHWSIVEVPKDRKLLTFFNHMGPDGPHLPGYGRRRAQYDLLREQGRFSPALPKHWWELPKAYRSAELVQDASGTAVISMLTERYGVFHALAPVPDSPLLAGGYGATPPDDYGNYKVEVITWTLWTVASRPGGGIGVGRVVGDIETHSRIYLGLGVGAPNGPPVVLFQDANRFGGLAWDGESYQPSLLAPSPIDELCR